MELNFNEERERLQLVRADLLARVAAIENAMAALTGATDVPAKSNGRSGKLSPVSQATAVDGRSRMSAKNRKAASLRMKAYWAERRKAAKSSK